jgi:folylpolyglutamate synthase/dihydropteroate synthase
MGNVEWLEALSPWPSDGFGTERMRALLAEVGDPQLAYPAIHVVGTNGKSTTSRMIEALLAEAGLRVGTYLSPHVRGWEERIRVDGDEVDFERALGSVREACERLGATQFETLTAAAFVEFAEAAVDVAVVEAGLGGRHDATNVLDSRVVVLTNVALDHTDVLGETREAIAAEKLAVVHEGATVVIGEPERSRSRSGTALTTSRASAGSCRGCRAEAGSLFARSWPRSTRTRCSEPSPSSATRSSPPPRRAAAHCPPRSFRALLRRIFQSFLRGLNP